MDRAPPKILNTTVLHHGWSSFLLAKVRLTDGSVVTREIEAHADVAAVLPYDANRRTALLVRQFRPVVLFAGAGDGMQTEVVAGLIDKGETPETTARREAMEETGVRLDALEPVATAFATPGISTERLNLYLAPYGEADRVGRGGGAAGEHEDIEVLELPLAEIAAMLSRGDLPDMKTVALVLALQARRPELFA